MYKFNWKNSNYSYGGTRDDLMSDLRASMHDVRHLDDPRELEVVTEFWDNLDITNRFQAGQLLAQLRHEEELEVSEVTD